MSDWNTNNLACLKTWIHLKVLNQHNRVFKTTGSLKMKQLTFWNQAASPDIRSVAAKTISFQLDNMFRMFDKAVYETESSKNKAVKSMQRILMDESATVFDLAVEIDNNYRFRGESEDEAIL